MVSLEKKQRAGRFTMRLHALTLLCSISAFAVAQDPIPGFEEPFPHLGIQALSEELTKIGSAGLIREKHVPELQRPLSKAVEALQSADSSKAIQHLSVFRNKVSAQVAPEIGIKLDVQASVIQEQITEISSRAVIASIGPCVVPGPDDFQSLAVGPGEALTTISEALAFASAHGFDAVEVVLAPSAYREGLITIHRHTRFVAPAGAANIVGGILNTGPYLLELRDVVVTGSPGTKGSAISADNQCAVTILSNVEVQFAEGTGVRQQGGSFTADGLTVAFSNAPESPSMADRHVGRGLHLSDGASACMTNVSLDRNDAGALLAEGFLTRVFVSGLTTRNNTVSPIVRQELVTTGSPPSGFGSVEVRDEALMLGEWVEIYSDEIIGLLVGNNAQAHIRYSAVAQTEDIDIGSGKSVGGRNFSVISGALEVTSILSRLSGVGIAVHNVRGGFLKTSDVFVSQNEVGIFVETDSSEQSTCALQCLGVRYERNGERSQFSFLPIPDTGGPPPVCPACPSVSFMPSWCSE